MQSTNRFVMTILFLGSILVSYTHCLGPTQTKKSGLSFNSSPLETGSDSGSNTGSSTGGSGTTTGGGDQDAVSVQAFSQTVYPITRARCVACHGSFQTPLHAVSDVQQAHDAVIDSFKVNFDNIPTSRMVLKLRDESHNCWNGDCNSNATEMENAIMLWKQAIDDAGGGTTGGSDDGGPGTDPVIQTNESQALILELDPTNAMDNGTIVVETDAASIAAPMVRGNQNGMNYLYVANNGNLVQSNNVNAGAAYMNFENSMSDSYKIYGYVDAPTNSDNSFFVRVDNGNYQEWHITPTAGFEWREVSNTANQNPVNLFIPAGGHVLEVRQREDGTKIARLVISNDPNINLDNLDSGVTATITFDISALVGTTAMFTIDVQDFDMYSYKLSNPTITTAARVKVKNIKPLINGNYNPQHSTYTLVDTTHQGGTTVLSNRALLALKDQGVDTDRLSFSFEILEQN